MMQHRKTLSELKAYCIEMLTIESVFSDKGNRLKELRELIDQVFQLIKHEPAVRALGKSASDLAFRAFWSLAAQDHYVRSFHYSFSSLSKKDVVTDIFGFLEQLQKLYDIAGNRSAATGDVIPFRQPTRMQ